MRAENLSRGLKNEGMIGRNQWEKRASGKTSKENVLRRADKQDVLNAEERKSNLIIDL